MPLTSETHRGSQVELTAAVRLHATADSVELRTGSCLECQACRHSFLDHCTSPVAPVSAVRWSGGSGVADLEAWAALLTAVDVLMHGRTPFPRVGVIGALRSVSLVGGVLAAAGVSVAAVETEAELSPGSAEARAVSTRLRQGAEGPPGPPDVVLATDNNLALATRLVRRGGSVAAVGRRGDASVPMASLVQRELTVLVARDRAGVAAGGSLLSTVDGWTRQDGETHD